MEPKEDVIKVEADQSDELQVPGVVEDVEDVEGKRKTKKGYFPCRFCNKKFDKHQALGGHMNSHHDARNSEKLSKLFAKMNASQVGHAMNSSQSNYGIQPGQSRQSMNTSQSGYMAQQGQSRPLMSRSQPGYMIQPGQSRPLMNRSQSGYMAQQGQSRQLMNTRPYVQGSSFQPANNFDQLQQAQIESLRPQQAQINSSQLQHSTELLPTSQQRSCFQAIQEDSQALQELHLLEVPCIGDPNTPKKTDSFDNLLLTPDEMDFLEECIGNPQAPEDMDMQNNIWKI